MVCDTLRAVKESVELAVLHVREFSCYRVEFGVECICSVTSVSTCAINEDSKFFDLVCVCVLGTLLKCVDLFTTAELEVFYPYIKMHVIPVLHFSLFRVFISETLMQFGQELH